MPYGSDVCEHAQERLHFGQQSCSCIGVFSISRGCGLGLQVVVTWARQL